MSYPQGGGGSPRGTQTSSAYALAKPYDLSGPMTAERMAQIDEMFDLLFRNLTTAAADIEEAGGSSISGSVTNGNVPKFSGTSGTLADSGKAAADLVTGPSSVTADGNVALFNGTTGKIIKDGSSIGSLLAGQGQIVIASVDLTSAQIQNLTTTPIQIIAAPGAGKFIRLISGPFSICEVTATSFNATVSATLRYTAVTALTTGNISIVATGSTGKRTAYTDLGADAANAVDIVNSAVEVHGVSGVPTQGTMTNNACRISVAYCILNSPY